MRSRLKTSCIIVAAGRGTRLNADSPGQMPAKQYMPLGGIAMLARVIDRFLNHPLIASVQVVIHPDDHAAYNSAIEGNDHEKLRPPAHGGATRQASVLAGLEAMSDINPDLVLVHDAARPFVSANLITAIVEALSNAVAVIPVLPLVDTIKQVKQGKVIATPDRDDLAAVQTPQGFRFNDILTAHRLAATRAVSGLTDDAAIAEAGGISVATIDGDTQNWKITTADDLARAQALFARDSAMETRTGQGFDVHRFEPGDHVMLAGINIPHDQGLAGHSDADVALHALTDALLGAHGAGDIGRHFPPDDEQWKDSDSSIFLEKARQLIADAGGRIVNIDITIICETPKIAPHHNAMQARIAGMLELAPDRVSVKATTSEGLGFTGRGEGIAALASATIELPRKN